MKWQYYVFTLIFCSLISTGTFADRQDDNKGLEISSENKSKNDDKNSRQDSEQVSEILEKIGYFEYYLDQCKSSDAEANAQLVRIFENAMDSVETFNSRKIKSTVSKILEKGKKKAKQVRNGKDENIYCQHNYMLQIEYRKFAKKYDT